MLGSLRFCKHPSSGVVKRYIRAEKLCRQLVLIQFSYYLYCAILPPTTCNMAYFKIIFIMMTARNETGSTLHTRSRTPKIYYLASAVDKFKLQRPFSGWENRRNGSLIADWLFLANHWLRRLLGNRDR